jgi:hypothetical protein
MAGLVALPRSWGKQKPPIGTPIDRSRPVGRSVVRLWRFDSLADRDASSGVPLTATGAPAVGMGVWGNSGLAGVHPGVSLDYWSHPAVAELQGLKAFSVVCVHAIDVSPSGTSWDFFGKWDNGGGTTQHFLRASGGNFQWFVTNAASSTASCSYPDTAWPARTRHVSVWTADGANLRAYDNGVLIGGPTALAGPYLPADSPAWGIGFGRSSGINPGDVTLFWRLAYFAYLNRAMTAAEAQGLYLDPFAIFTPPATQRYFAAAAGGADATATPATATAAWTANAPSVSADATVAPAGASAAWVANPPSVSVDIAASPAVASAIWTAGVPSVAGDAAVSPATAAAAWVTGTPAVAADAVITTATAPAAWTVNDPAVFLGGTAVAGEPDQLGNTIALSRPVASGWL